jgi:tetratricopeptide (TPR) repeat protein
MGRKSKRKSVKDTKLSSIKMLQNSIVSVLHSTDDLYASQDWESVVSNVESLDSEFLQVFDGASCFLRHYSLFYFKVALSYLQLGDRNTAIAYLEKTIWTTKKTSSTKSAIESALVIQEESEYNLLECYLAEGRYGETPSLFRKIYHRTICNSKKVALLLKFLLCLQSRYQHSLALEVAQDYLKDFEEDDDEGTSVRFQILTVIGSSHQALKNFRKAISVFRKILESKMIDACDILTQARVLSNLGRSCACLGDTAEAEFCVERVVQLLSKDALPNSTLLEECIHNVADIYFHLKDHEKDAIKSYQRCLELSEKCVSATEMIPSSDPDHTRGLVFRRLGLTHLKLKNWEDAIMNFNNSIISMSLSKLKKERVEALCVIYQDFGRAYMDQLFGDERLEYDLEKRRQVLNQALKFSLKASQIFSQGFECDHSVYLDLAHQTFLRGDFDQARDILKQYLDLEYQTGPISCRGCHQISTKEATLQVCSGCKVVAFCSEDHQRRVWKNEDRRTSHRKICNLLKVLRRVKKGMYTNEFFDKILDEYFTNLFKGVQPLYKMSNVAESFFVEERKDAAIDII